MKFTEKKLLSQNCYSIGVLTTLLIASCASVATLQANQVSTNYASASHSTPTLLDRYKFAKERNERLVRNGKGKVQEEGLLWGIRGCSWQAKGDPYSWSAGICFN